MELEERGEARICNPACQAELLTALKKRDLEGFKRLLPVTNPNHFYDAPDFGTCIYITAVKGLPEFAKLLLTEKVDVNGYNKIRKNTPLHAACVEGHPEIVRLFLNHSANISALDDFGRVPLHSAANGPGGKKEYTEGHLECLKILLDSGSNINTQDRSGATALRLSLLRNHKKAAEMLLSFGANPDIDSSSGKTVRSLIQEKMPDAYERLPPSGIYKISEVEDVGKLLFRHLYKKNLFEFQKLLQVAINTGVNIGQINDGKYTLLQHTCEHEGLDEFIPILLKIPSVDPNGTCTGSSWKPILLASYQGNYNALYNLVSHEMTDITVIDDNTRKETALHKVARMERGSKDNKSYLKCLNILLESSKQQVAFKDSLPPSRKRLNINAVDALGNTALHYAARNLDGGGKQVEEIVSALLRAGSYVGIQNRMGEPAISRVTPSILEDYLDDCIGTNGEAPCEEGYELMFDYTMLIPPSAISNENTELTEDIDESASSIMETQPLSYICNAKEHQRLLKHPVITSFLYLKWHRIRMIFYGNLIFYIIFVSFLTSYILGVYGRDPPEDKDDSSSMDWIDGCSIISQFLLAILALREVFQFIISPFRYIKSLENLLEVTLITLAVIMLLSNFEHHVKQHLAAVVILLLWIELVLLVGRHPNLSTYITMFTTVSLNFITFLLWYSLLIVAFALSFFVLFRKGEVKEETNNKNGEAAEEEEKNYFSDPGRAVLKTAVMLTGEFDFNDLPLDTFMITSHLVFLLFLFLIAVVLLNLLNGLAVSDTQAVKDKAELVGYLSRVALVSHVESMMLGKPLQYWNKLTKCCCKRNVYHTKLPGEMNKTRNGFGESILIFPELSRIQVLVNRGGKIQPHCCPKKNRCGPSCMMDRRIIQVARSVISKRAQRTEMDEIRQRLESIEDLVKQVANALISNSQKKE